MFAHYYRELHGFLSRQVNDHDAAADLAQESVARALTLQQSGVAVIDPRAMLYRIARNLLVDQYRHARIRAHESIHSCDEQDVPAAPQHQQPEESLDFTRYAERIVATIEALPPRCREAFVLNRFDGMSHTEIAERMGISRNMVAQHITRGLLACKACDDNYRTLWPARSESGGRE